MRAVIREIGLSGYLFEASNVGMYGALRQQINWRFGWDGWDGEDVVREVRWDGEDVVREVRWVVLSVLCCLMMGRDYEISWL
jgi:hypothetical protein